VRQADRLAATKTLSVKGYSIFFSLVRLNFNLPFETRDLLSVLELQSSEQIP